MENNDKNRKKLDLKDIRNKSVLSKSITKLSYNQSQYLTDEMKCDYHRAAVL